MDDSQARRSAIRKETRIAAVMNVVLGVVFFLIVFGWSRAATSSLALDFLPQTMGMTFLGGMVSSLICLSKVKKGTLVPAGPVPTRRQQAGRVFAGALAATMVFGGAVALLFVAFGPVDFAPAPALAIKALYGIVMGFVTTPPILRMALGMPVWPRPRPNALAGAHR